MASTLVQFRLDDVVKAKAALICESIGMDLNAYLKLSVNRLILENGVPFAMKAGIPSIIDNNPGLALMMRMGRSAEEAGVADMTLDEINAEIAAARAERGAVE